MRLAGWLFIVLGVALLACARPISQRFCVKGSRSDEPGAWLINALGLLDDDRSRWTRLLAAVLCGLAFITAGVAVAAGWWDAAS